MIDSVLDVPIQEEHYARTGKKGHVCVFLSSAGEQGSMEAWFLQQEGGKPKPWT